MHHNKNLEQRTQYLGTFSKFARKKARSQVLRLFHGWRGAACGILNQKFTTYDKDPTRNSIYIMQTWVTIQAECGKRSLPLVQCPFLLLTLSM